MPACFLMLLALTAGAQADQRPLTVYVGPRIVTNAGFTEPVPKEIRESIEHVRKELKQYYWVRSVQGPAADLTLLITDRSMNAFPGGAIATRIGQTVIATPYDHVWMTLHLELQAGSYTKTIHGIDQSWPRAAKKAVSEVTGWIAANRAKLLELHSPDAPPR